ncbi:PAS domain S-box protein [Paenibacillus sp. LMG 31460]|uniref:PAS domain S-box protein n=1 Tax=Paenibacillus germinis TaxID=2654979 RepID=A0ABX1Z1S8_9BACL|nr:PAS domain S-box protein [Paenibacillus germinis]NOU85981.1 PAS domain S-box protein [Paenibacillus germinis]
MINALMANEKIIPRHVAQFMHALMNLSSDGMVIVDLEGKIVEVNEIFGKLHGFSREDLLGKILPLEPFVIEGDKVSHFHKDVIFSPIYDEQGKVIALMGFEKSGRLEK